MKTKRFLIAALLATAMLLASCGNALNSAAKAQGETTAPGTGLVRVAINGENRSARTVFPTLPATTGIYYDYTFDADPGDGTTQTLPAGGPVLNGQSTFVLETGTYTLKVDAWDDAIRTTKLWTSVPSDPFTVIYGNSTPPTVTVNLLPYGDGTSTGEFYIWIGFPASATVDYLTWAPLDGSAAPVSLFLEAGDNQTTFYSRGKTGIAPGTYLVRTHLTDGTKTAGREAVVRIYAGLATYIDPTGSYWGFGISEPGFAFTTATFSDYAPDFAPGTYTKLTVGTLGGENYPTLNAAFTYITGEPAANYVITLTSDSTNTAVATLNQSGAVVSVHGNGYTITNANSAVGIEVRDGSLILRDLTLEANSGYSPEGVSILSFGASARMAEGVTITGFDDYGVYVSLGTFDQDGGSILGNGNGNNGNGVHVNGGTFTQNGGFITNNSGHNGGGVYVRNGGTFHQTGGLISGNTAAQNGGGVYVHNGGTFVLESGTISGNTAQNGGGVYVLSGGTFTMSGGQITANNTAQTGKTLYNDGSALYAGTLGSANIVSSTYTNLALPYDSDNDGVGDPAPQN